MCMRTATINEAKERLEELIEAARAGESVEITNGGEPVASIRAADQTLSTAAESAASSSRRLRELKELGILTSPQVPDPERRHLRARVTAAFAQSRQPAGVLAALLEERHSAR